MDFLPSCGFTGLVVRQCDFVMESVSWDPDMYRVRLNGEQTQFTADRNRVLVGSALENLSPAAICKYFVAQHLIFNNSLLWS